MRTRASCRYDPAMSEVGAVPAPRSGVASGEVSERGELLDGSLQLALEGRCELAAEEWIVSITLAWPLAEAGEVPLAEGDLALDAADRSLFAVLDEGSATIDLETGASVVTARFHVDGMEGEMIDASSIECHLEVDIEHWRGELALASDGSAAGG